MACPESAELAKGAKRAQGQHQRLNWDIRGGGGFKLAECPGGWKGQAAFREQSGVSGSWCVQKGRGEER